MPVKIYWGPPGSYKTSSAVMDDVATCAADGRVLITNVRGLSEALIREHAPKVASGFEVIHLRNDIPEQLERLRRWWHWAPPGAFIVLDEVQAVYPPDWSRSDLRQLDMKEDRVINGNILPKDVALIFDMHRHGNWDLTFTTPSIKKVRPEIRAASECAYKHKNMAIHGAIFRGKFRQMQHLAEDNGNPSDIYVQRTRVIKPWVFKCYQSTATGTVSDTKVGLSLLASPKLLGLVVVVVCAISALVVVGRPKALGGGKHKSDSVAAEKADSAGSNAAVGNKANGVSAAQSGPVKPKETDYRVIGAYQSATARGYAVLYSEGTGDLRVPIGKCRRDDYAGWWCQFEGALVTERSGKAPPHIEPKEFLAVVSTAAS
ncbi:MAG: zona occludens toxin [Hydrocarboniphaga sp.]|uniref:zonular occludens toxin domain-containing protein n=1 Tax=Hydrocarboniphaga sp. TaxID=2033016 RepID=UPI00263068D3|nr:zonular occludens toxin domain-containing protein [Hydrocarboniphaga sp.]MDB5970110.1 zona occludens toxin [Hydrocarboniphaga sp.]